MAAVVFGVGVFLFEGGFEGVFFAFAVFAVGGLVGIGAGGVAEVVAEGIGPEGGVDDFDVFFGNLFGVVVMLLVEAFFEGVVHGVDSDFAVFVTVEGVEIGFLDEEDDKEKGRKNGNDNNL